MVKHLKILYLSSSTNKEIIWLVQVAAKRWRGLSSSVIHRYLFLNQTKGINDNSFKILLQAWNIYKVLQNTIIKFSEDIKIAKQYEDALFLIP